MLYWVLQLLGWGFYFYAQASGEVIFASTSWSRASLLWGGVCLAGVTLTHAFRWLLKRQDWLALRPAALSPRVLAAVLILGAALALVTGVLSDAVYGARVAPIFQAFYVRLSDGDRLRNQSIAMLVVAVSWVAIYLSLAMQRRHFRLQVEQAQLGEALRAAELRLLKSQLNPHFLFNALNGLRSLIADEPARARDAVTQLARMLRHTLASGDDDLVSLERELELVEDYLSLESLRLESRLRVERDVDDAARTVRVPAMLLQTLVENALKHGIAQLKEGGTLRIRAKVADGELQLHVTNPRPLQTAGPDTEGPGSDGVGLKNARERLRLLFGERGSLRVDFTRPGEAEAEVRLPA